MEYQVIINAENTRVIEIKRSKKLNAPKILVHGISEETLYKLRSIGQDIRRHQKIAKTLSFSESLRKIPSLKTI